MKQVYSARTELEAHQVRLYLESHDVRAMVIGETAAFTNFAFTPGSEPSVGVDDADFERATLLMQNYPAGQVESTHHGRWTCPACGEPGEETFDLCWKCDSPRPAHSAATAPDSSVNAVPESDSHLDKVSMELTSTSPNLEKSDPLDAAQLPARPKVGLWLEVLFLLAISQPSFAHDWFYSLLESVRSERTFASQSELIFIFEMIIAGCALLIIARSGESWSTFGLQRPRLLWDLLGAGVLYLVTVRAVALSNGIFLDALQEWLPRDTYHRLIELPSDWIPPHGGTDLLIALITCLAIGFSEELVYRGFLIPRLEQLLGSTWISVLLSSLLFASIHFPGNGVFGIWNALGFGIIFGSVFAYFRRLWPLIFAHALLDFVLMLRPGEA